MGNGTASPSCVNGSVHDCRGRFPMLGGAQSVRSWPIGLATAAARHGRLLRVNVPAASAFVNPDSTHHGPRQEAGGISIIPLIQLPPRSSGHHRGVEPAGEIGGARRASKPGEPGRALHREPLDAATCRAPRRALGAASSSSPRLATSRSTVALAPRPIGAAQSACARSLLLLATSGAPADSFFWRACVPAPPGWLFAEY
jgi:hypothetical protein